MNDEFQSPTSSTQPQVRIQAIHSKFDFLIRLLIGVCLVLFGISVGVVGNNLFSKNVSKSIIVQGTPVVQTQNVPIPTESLIRLFYESSKMATYENDYLKISFPENWKIVLDGPNYFSIYPLNHDPAFPTNSITFFIDKSASFSSSPTPNQNMSQYQTISIAGINGLRSDYVPNNLVRTGGEDCDDIEILLPVNKALLKIYSCKQIEEGMNEIFKTLSIK